MAHETSCAHAKHVGHASQQGISHSSILLSMQQAHVTAKRVFGSTCKHGRRRAVAPHAPMQCQHPDPRSDSSCSAPAARCQGSPAPHVQFLLTVRMFNCGDVKARRRRLECACSTMSAMLALPRNVIHSVHQHVAQHSPPLVQPSRTLAENRMRSLGPNFSSGAALKEARFSAALSSPCNAKCQQHDCAPLSCYI